MTIILIVGLIISLFPFIYLIYKYVKRDKRNTFFEPKFLGLPIKDFMTTLIGFLGFWGLVIGIIQVQKQISMNAKKTLGEHFYPGLIFQKLH